MKEILKTVSEKTGDKPRWEVTENELKDFGNKLIEWMTVKQDESAPNDNFLYSEFCQQNNLFESDIDYFINLYDSFYETMKRAEEIQRTKIKGFAASGNIQPQIAKKLLSEKSKIVRKEDKKANKSEKLTNKTIRFCKEYIIDYNGRQAAIKAGYSKKTAQNAASRLLTIVKVQNYISELESKKLDRNEITKDRILREMASIAFSDIRDYINEENQIISIKSLPREKAAAIKKVKTTKSEIIVDGENIGDKIITEIELIDKQRSLEGLDKHAGLYEETINHKGDMTFNIEVADAKTKKILGDIFKKLDEDEDNEDNNRIR